jgi:hypothetical protein
LIFVALANFTRFSPRESAYATVSRASWQEIRVGRRKRRIALLFHIGYRDPRSQTRDLGHPSIFPLSATADGRSAGD